MLNAAERERSCLYARKKWVVDALRRRVRRGTLLEVAPNCFVRWSTWQKLKKLPRYLWIIRAVAKARRGCVFCGASAAALYGLYVPYADMGRVHIATSKKAHTRSSRLVARHPVEADQTYVIDGLLVTSPLRTSFDCMRAHEFPEALAYADSTLRFLGVSKQDMQRYVDSHAHFRGVAAAREAVRFADPRAENGGESVARATMIEMGYMIPDLQRPFTDDISGDTYRTDFYWELPDGTTIAGELDGAQKYTDPDYMDGRNFSGVVRGERLRESRISKQVDGICRFTPDDVADHTYFARVLDSFGIPREPIPNQ